MIPDYQTLMLPVLKLFNEGKTSVKECVPSIKEQFDISDEEAEEIIPSGASLLYNRVHWARTYLSKAGLLQSPERGTHFITESGRNLLATNPSRIDNAMLREIAEFSEWQNQAGSQARSTKSSAPDSTPEKEQQTPEDAISEASKQLNRVLRDDLLQELHNVTPVRFERIILDLLSAMGFGGGTLSNTSLTPSTNDGGIDGVINEDALGLDAVFVQAKRNGAENKVGRPDIQKFVGSLTGEGASKGVFVTTSDFSREARDFIEKVQHRIVLINGVRMAELMIEYQVGVRTRSIVKIKSIDEEYFFE